MNILKHHLFWPCAWLTCASVIFTVLWWYVTDDRVSGILGNIATGLSGTVVTVLFVDRLVEAHQNRERKHYRDIALKSLAVPLRRHFGFLCEMLRVSVVKRPPQTASAFSELFGPEYITAVSFLDFSKPYAGGVLWADEAQTEFSWFLTALSRFLEKYAVYLESELVDIVEGILTSEMAGLAAHIQAIVHQRMASPRVFADATAAPLIQRYTHQFAVLAEAYNEISEADRRILPSPEMWRKDVMPAIGSALSRS